MNFIEFSQKFKISKDKESFVKKHIKRTYVPYAEKLAEAKKIAEVSTHIIVNQETGEQMYKKDTPIQYFLKTTRLLFLYTDIEIDNNDINKVYDTLAESGAFEYIFSSIPEGEITQFSSMIDMCVSDIYENERDLTSFFETKLTAFNLTFNEIVGAFQNTIGELTANLPVPESSEVSDTINQSTINDTETVD